MPSVPPYSPDLAASADFLFPNLKEWLGGRRLGSKDEIIAVMHSFFEDPINFII